MDAVHVVARLFDYLLAPSIAPNFHESPKHRQPGSRASHDERKTHDHPTRPTLSASKLFVRLIDHEVEEKIKAPENARDFTTTLDVEEQPPVHVLCWSPASASHARETDRGRTLQLWLSGARHLLSILERWRSREDDLRVQSAAKFVRVPVEDED